MPDLVLARILGAGLALVLQRISVDKLVYNCGAYGFEAALGAAIVHACLGVHAQLDVYAAAVTLLVVVLCDQLMSVLVLLVIHWHGGSMSRADVREVLLPACTLSVVSTAASVGLLLLVQVGALGVGVVLVSAVVATVAYRGYIATTRRHQRLELLHEFVNGGVGAESLSDVARQLLTRIRSLLRAESAEILLLTDAGRPEQSPGESASNPVRSAQQVTRIVDDEVAGFRTEQATAVLDWTTIRAVDQAEPLLAARSSKDRAVRRWLQEQGHRDAIVVPLPASSGYVGTLSVINRLGETATFTPDDLTLLLTLTGHFAVAAGSARLVERLAYDASHDALTGLANRAHLARKIHEHQEAAAARPDPTIVLLLDLDRFKEVNDGLGHAAGDRLLTVVAQRLREYLPRDATVARLGGDEFAALVPNHHTSEQSAVEFGERLAMYLARPVAVEEALVTPDVSIGLALIDGATSDSDLLRQADTAMYAAKSGDRTVAVYHPDMDRGRVENLALLTDLRSALLEHREQIAVYYQPKLDLQTRRVISAEALVRWNHPSLGVLGPDRFIALAETTGLIGHFLPVVLDAALAECRRWREDGHDLSIAVNLSARNVSDPTLPECVAQALHDARVPANRLILEITESSVISDPQQALQVLNQLANLGVVISLDDFGTGYSSLSYLQRLPVREVKIDRSFVQGLERSDPRPSRALISSITGLGAHLGLRVVAEGVESEATMDELHQLGCHVAQGFHISRPVPAADFRTWLKHSDPPQDDMPLRLVNAT